MSTSSSPRSARSCCSATLTIPSAASACEPTGSFSPGMPNSISPPMPASAASCAAFRSESSVCWTTPGIERIAHRGVDALLDEDRQHEVRRRQPGLRGQPPQRGRRPEPTPAREARVDPPVTCPRRPPTRAATGRTRPARRPAAPTAAVSGCTSTRRPNSCGAGRGRRADHGDDGLGVRLAGDADQVAHGARRGEADRVEAAALDRLAHRRGRRGRPHGAVGGDVVDLPAALLEPGGERLGGDVGARQQHPVDRVEDVVVGREVGQQALAGLLARRAPAPGTMPKARTASAVCSPTQATLTPANARASRPSSVNFSRTAFTALTEVNTIQP